MAEGLEVLGYGFGEIGSSLVLRLIVHEPPSKGDMKVRFE